MISKRPNIVLIITDQQRYDTVAALGYPYMHTPNLDRLSKEGVVFERMFITSPSCAPSRASLFTGLYPHTNGVFRNDEPWSHTWVQRLASSGYRCVNIGKMHTSPFEKSFGFHERHVIENKDRATPRLPFYWDNWDKAFHARRLEKPSRVTYARRPDYRERLGAFVWELPAELHSDNFVPSMAVQWLDSYPGTEPFFLEIGIPGPHPPYDPTQEFLDLYEESDLPVPVQDPAEMEAQPSALRRLREQHIGMDHDAIVHLRTPNPEQTRRQRMHYFANVSMIDRQVSNILSALERRGVLDETIIIYTSDHGDCLNDHGHSQKWTMYEQVVHVPAIVWGSGYTSGLRITDLVSLFDLGPTILEMAGLTPPKWMEARSLRPYLAGEPVERAEYVFAEHAGDRILDGTTFMTMVRGERWKLVHFADSDEGQLFDLKEDPDEMHNLWSDAGASARKRELVDEILRWRLDSALKTQGWISAVVDNAQ